MAVLRLKSLLAKVTKISMFLKTERSIILQLKYAKAIRLIQIDRVTKFIRHPTSDGRIGGSRTIIMKIFFIQNYEYCNDVEISIKGIFCV